MVALEILSLWSDKAKPVTLQPLQAPKPKTNLQMLTQTVFEPPNSNHRAGILNSLLLRALKAMTDRPQSGHMHVAIMWTSFCNSLKAPLSAEVWGCKPM